MNASEIKLAEQLICQADPILATVIKAQTVAFKPTTGDYFSSLGRSIVSQQLSVAAARAIYGRLELATKLKPAAVLKLTELERKAIGLSQPKLTYIKDIAAHFLKDPQLYNHLEQQTDGQVIQELTALKGVGIWTAQMFLMSTLARKDVFAGGWCWTAKGDNAYLRLATTTEPQTARGFGS